MDRWIYVHDFIHGNYNVLIVNLLLFLNFHCTTTIRGYRDILLSLWFQYDQFCHSDIPRESPFNLWVLNILGNELVRSWFTYYSIPYDWDLYSIVEFDEAFFRPDGLYKVVSEISAQHIRRCRSLEIIEVSFDYICAEPNEEGSYYHYLKLVPVGTVNDRNWSELIVHLCPLQVVFGYKVRSRSRIQ